MVYIKNGYITNLIFYCIILLNKGEIAMKQTKWNFSAFMHMGDLKDYEKYNESTFEHYKNNFYQQIKQYYT